MKVRKFIVSVVGFMLLFLIFEGIFLFPQQSNAHNYSASLAIKKNNEYPEKIDTVNKDIDSPQDFKKLIEKKQEGCIIINITQNYDLNGEVITLPQDCILHFSGGVVCNGTLKGDNTCIDAPITKIFGKDIVIVGSWNVDYAYPEWFGAKGDGKTDDRIPIQLALSGFINTKLLPHRYLIGSYQVLNKKKYGLIIPAHHNLECCGLFDVSNAALVIGTQDIEIGIGVYSYVLIKGVSLVGYHYNSNKGGAHGVVGSGTVGIGNANYCDWARDLDFERVVCQAFDTGYDLMSFSVKFKTVWARICGIGFHMYSTNIAGINNGSAGTTISMINCYADHIYSIGYLVENEWYSQFLNCSCDRVAERNSMGNPTVDEKKNSCAYKLNNCSNCTMISCGAEDTYKALDITGCNNTIIGMQCFPVDPPEVKCSNGEKEIFDIIVVGDSGKTKTQNNILKNVRVNRTYNQYQSRTTVPNNDVCYIDNVINETPSSMRQKGAFNARPSAKEIGEGAFYYDTTNKRMIMSNGNYWVNVDGSPL